VIQLEGNDEVVLRNAAALFAQRLNRRLLLAHDFTEKSLDALPTLIRDAALAHALLAIALPPGNPGEYGVAQGAFWRAFVDVDRPILLLNMGSAPSGMPPDLRMWRLPIRAPNFEARRRNWEQAANACSANLDTARLADAFRFGQQRIAQVMELANGIAASRDNDGSSLGMDDVLDAGRIMSSPHLGPSGPADYATLHLSDLVLPPDKLTQLQQAAAWLRYRRTVHQDWGFGRSSRGAKGSSCCSRELPEPAKPWQPRCWPTIWDWSSSRSTCRAW